MKHKKPPFEITNQIIDYVAEIAELVGRLTAASPLSTSPTLRRANRIRTIHGSLAIEQNTLSLEQVTAVLNGKYVLAPPKDIAEVKNAYEIYERLDELDPYSADDLLTAHGIMTRGLVEESGMFRTRPVGVVDSEGHVLHFGTRPQYVPDLVMAVLEWTKTSEVHMLIRSCVFHYELELIHPFADGNGRVGRLWHTLPYRRRNGSRFCSLCIPSPPLSYSNVGACPPVFRSLPGSLTRAEDSVFLATWAVNLPLFRHRFWRGVAMPWFSERYASSISKSTRNFNASWKKRPVSLGTERAAVNSRRLGMRKDFALLPSGHFSCCRQKTAEKGAETRRRRENPAGTP